MKIYYDRKSESWYHIGTKANITMGGEKQIIEQNQAGLGDTCFDIRVRNNHGGPLIGIMAARKSDGSMAGNGHLFRELQKKLISLKGISFIFTPEGMQDGFIHGYIFLPDRLRWMRIKTPFPDLVYNRIPFRRVEQDDKYYAALATLKEKNIPFFNPCFINKYDLYQLFQHHPILQNFMPKTEIIRKSKDFQCFLENNQSAYLKPAQSAKGKGIYRVTQINQFEILLEGLSKQKIYPTLQSFWNEWETMLIEKNYIIQEEVHSDLLNGKRFDFRILAHAKDNEYQVTGIGIRQSQHQELTTHIPNGGKILSYELVRTKKHDQFIKTIVDHIGKTLSDKIGFFGEFSIDAGISLDGKYYIYEVNSKPMRFDEEEIEEKKISELCRLFLHLTNF
jgi:hypothetical protein